MNHSPEPEKSNRYLYYTAAVLLLMGTVISAILKIRIGLDIDETYIAYLAYRIQDGMVPLRDSWDLYATCALIPAVFVKAFLAFTHSLRGCILYLRTISVLIQFGAALFSFFILKKYYSKKAAFAAMIVIANILPRAIQNLDYGFSTTVLLLLSSVLLLDVCKKGEQNSWLQIIIAGVFYGLSVFVYPTMVLTIPVFLIILGKKINPDRKTRILYSLLFWGMCLLLFLAFMAYIFSHISPDQFFISLRGVLHTDDHSRRFSAFSNVRSMIKLVIRTGGLLSGAVILYLPFRKKLSAVWICYFYMLLIFIVIVGLNLTGIRPSGPFGLLERYLGMAILAVWIGFFKEKDNILNRFFILPGIAEYLGALMGSNLGFGENALYLELVLVGFVVYMVNLTEQKPGAFMGKEKIFAECCVFILLLELVFSKGYFVRVDGTGPANILESRETYSSEDPADGILLYPDTIQKWNRQKNEIRENSSGSHTYVCITTNPLINCYVKGNLKAPQYVPTMSPGSQWIDFYSLPGNELPDIIYIDREKYPELEDFLSTDFGKYIRNIYIPDDNDAVPDFHIMNRLD